MVHDFTARHDPPRVMHEIGEQPILVTGQLDGGAVDGHSSCSRIEADRAGDKFACRMAGGPAQQRAYSREHFFHVKGLGDVVVGACVEALNLVAPSIAGGKDEHGHGPSRFAPGLQHRNAVPLRQADIQNDGVIGLGVAEEPTFFPVKGAVDRVSRCFKRGHDLAVEISVVFDNEQAHESKL